jgi:A/G-specific adenine glycosylase
MASKLNLKQPVEVKRFRRELLRWYHKNRRALPWRENRDPYRVWVSEIMLQQTRVAAVLAHYKSFLNRFPNISKLAAADESNVLAAWSGLGYYRRARMMHHAARLLAAEWKANLPKTSSELRLLPGIGRYTANAIASIAFGEAVAVVDGNVERVLTRVLDGNLPAAELWDCAQRLLDTESPGDFNQAMMELGATVCLPQTPVCGSCPVRHACNWKQRSKVKTNSTDSRVRRSESLLVARRRGALLLSKRSSQERLMPGMWEFPRLEADDSEKPLLKVRHSITTTDWTISVFVRESPAPDPRCRWVPLSRVRQIPLTGLTRKVLRRLELLA